MAASDCPSPLAIGCFRSLIRKTRLDGVMEVLAPDQVQDAGNQLNRGGRNDGDRPWVALYRSFP